MKDHFTSLTLENEGRRALGLENRGGLGGVIDADFIDRKGGAFTVLVASLAPYYKTGSAEIQEEINDLIQHFYYLNNDISDDEYNDGVENVKNALRKFLDRRG